MSARHTPGPWRAETDQTQHPPVAVWSERHKEGSVLRECVAEVLGAADSECTQSDARLIAAAPDLLDACCTALSFVRGKNKNLPAVMAQLAAAIRAATGGES